MTNLPEEARKTLDEAYPRLVWQHVFNFTPKGYGKISVARFEGDEPEKEVVWSEKASAELIHVAGNGGSVSFFNGAKEKHMTNLNLSKLFETAHYSEAERTDWYNKHVHQYSSKLQSAALGDL
jgi:hypothetical protein